RRGGRAGARAGDAPRAPGPAGVHAAPRLRQRGGEGGAPLPRPGGSPGAPRARRARAGGSARGRPRPAPRRRAVLLAHGARGGARRGDRAVARARRARQGGRELSEPIRDKAELQQFYDYPEVVATYLQRKALPLGAVLHARQVAFLNQAIARLRPARLLEVAPGPARLRAELHPVPLGVGLEFSPRMLAEARRRTRAHGVPEWRFVRGDGFALPFRTASFDFAFSVRFVRRFEPAPRQRLYAELRRVLKPGRSEERRVGWGGR